MVSNRDGSAMKIGFAGLWHLGSVMSAVFASAGHDVVAYDEPGVIEAFQARRLPVDEPGLHALVASEVAAGRLTYTSDAAALASCEIVWITYDTTVRDDGSADVEDVLSRVISLAPLLRRGTLVVVSSQLPVGSIAELERRTGAVAPERTLRFAYSPENLRLGTSIAYMRAPDRYVVGVRSAADETLLREAFAPLSPDVEAMSVESAEMTKHALNAFLATSVAFINELAGLCERTGADAREVERGLKTDARIGKRAYLRAGGPYAGATLARDINFVIENERRYDLRPLFFEGVRAANDWHATWTQRRFVEVVGEPRGRTVALLGLVYKPGTNTLRGSNAMVFATWFAQHGGRVRAYDPANVVLEPGTGAHIELCASAQDALEGADAAIVGTEWPAFREIPSETFRTALRFPNVFDPGRFLAEKLAGDAGLRYFAIGVGHSERTGATAGEPLA